jgi:CubicO group peptidase (beta-lactamase class C family)
VDAETAAAAEGPRPAAAKQAGPSAGALLTEPDAAAALGNDLVARLAAAVDRRAARHVGLAVAVLIGGRAAFFSRGRVHRDRPGAPAPDTLFEIGSITKTFTATTLALLALEGTVALDDPLQRYLPAGVELPVRGRPITLADLATHSSGLPASHPGMLRQWWHHRSDPYAAITFDDLNAAVNRTKLRAAPGEKWRYSNFGAALLGNALAARAGTSYEDLVRRSICAPLALADTVLTVDDERAGRFAQGHDRRRRPVSHWELPALAGAGALRSTAADMIAYLGGHLAAETHSSPGSGSPDAGGATMDLHAAMRATHEVRFRRGRIVMGLGWIFMPRKGMPHPIVFHNGGTGGFRSFAGFVPQTQTAAVVLANDGHSADRLGADLLLVLHEAAG